MDQNEPLGQLLLAMQYLGPVFSLWGVIETPDEDLRCECGAADCQTPGKHPRQKNWQKIATLDIEQCQAWSEQWLQGNHGIAMGKMSVGLDPDVRDEKNGWAELEQLEFDAGERTPYTVTVETGRGNGLRHLFFQPPARFLRNRTNCLPGVDVRCAGGSASSVDRIRFHEIMEW